MVGNKRFRSIATSDWVGALRRCAHTQPYVRFVKWPARSGLAMERKRPETPESRLEKHGVSGLKIRSRSPQAKILERRKRVVGSMKSAYKCLAHLFFDVPKSSFRHRKSSFGEHEARCLFCTHCPRGSSIDSHCPSLSYSLAFRVGFCEPVP